MAGIGASRHIVTEGGTEWELTQAENAIVAAGNDPTALALAQRRHADAIRNMMQGAIVPSFVALVERVLGEKIDPVAGNIDGLRTDVQQLALESAARLGKLEARMNESEADRADRLCELNVIEQAINVCQTTVVEGAWARGQELTVHGWIYRLSDGIARDLGVSISSTDDIVPNRELACEKLMSRQPLWLP
jgi:hypothetical protein